MNSKNARVMLAVAVPLAILAASNARVIQTNSAGDNVHVIDPATNQVVGVIQGIEVPHGVVIAPDGNRILRHRRTHAHFGCSGCKESQGHQENSTQRPAQ